MRSRPLQAANWNARSTRLVRLRTGAHHSLPRRQTRRTPQRDVRSAAAATAAPTTLYEESLSARRHLASVAGHTVVQTSLIEAQQSPGRIGPHVVRDRFRRIQQLAISRSTRAGQLLGRTVFDDAAAVHDEHAIERQRVLDIVRDVHERRVRPAATYDCQKPPAARALESA